MKIKTISILFSIFFPLNLLGMESGSNPSLKTSTKEDTIVWLKTKIQPINAGRFRKPNNPGAQANCTYCAEECVKVLSGIKEPERVPAKKKNFDITSRPDNSGTITYHEALRQEQADLIPLQEFIETIDLLEDKPTSSINLNETPPHASLKYITSSRNTIIDNIKSLAGSAVSHGNDKTLAGLVYYYYKNIDAGHLANFYRDKDGNVFFVDSQSEEITETPPTKILNYEIADTMFFYPMAPKGGYYIKRETLMPVKEEKKIHEEPDIEIIKERLLKRQKKTIDEEYKVAPTPETSDQSYINEHFIKLMQNYKNLALTKYSTDFIIEEIENWVINKKPDLKKNSLDTDLSVNALYIAFVLDNRDLTGFLMAHDADPSFMISLLNQYRNTIDQKKLKVFLSIYKYKNAFLLLGAAKYNNLGLARKVMESFDSERLLKIPLFDNQKNTPLMLALINKNIEMIKLLGSVFPLDNNHRNSDKLTALDLLKSSQLEYLRPNLKVIEEKSPQKVVEEKPHKVTEAKSSQQLIAEQNKIDEEFAKMIETAFKNKDNSEQIVNAIKHFVIHQKPNLELNSLKYQPPLNALWYALCLRNIELTRFLMAFNAQPQAMISFLIKNKALLEKEDKNLYEKFMKVYTYQDPQLLLYAAYFENIWVAQLVTTAITEISASTIVDEHGNNPLMIAIMKKNEPLIKCFNKLYRLDDHYKNNNNNTAYDLLRFYNPNYYAIQKNDSELEEKKLLLKEYKAIGNKLIKLLKKHTCKDVTEAKIAMLSTENPAKNIALAFTNILQEKFLKLINEPIFGESPLAHHIAEHKYLDFLALLIVNGADITQKYNHKMSVLDYLNTQEQSLLLDMIYYYYLLSQYDATSDIYEIKPADADMLKYHQDLILRNYLIVALSVYEKFIESNPLQAFKWIRVTQLKNSKIDILTLDCHGSTVFHDAAKSGIFPNLLNLWYAAQGNQHYFSIKNKEGKTPLDYYTPEQFDKFKLLIQHPEKIDSFTDKKIDSMIDSFLRDLNSGITQLPTVVLPFNQRIIKIINFCTTCMKHNSREELKKIFSTPIASQKGMTLLHCLAYANMRNELYYVVNLIGQPNLIYDNAGKTFKDYLKKQ